MVTTSLFAPAAMSMLLPQSHTHQRNRLQQIISNFVIFLLPNIPKHSHNHNTRNNKNYDLLYNRLKKSQNHPNYVGCKFYNHLPSKLKDCENINKFKNSLKSFLTNNPFYKISEYLEEEHEDYAN
jgi:hypothetical protein